MSDSITLLLVGDVMIGRGVDQRLSNEIPEYPWGDTLPLFRRADWRACNLECVLSDHHSPWVRSPKMFHFRSRARHVAALKAAGIDVVSLANNHTLDHNYKGLIDMLRVLDGSSIGHSGAGLNLGEASRMAVAEVRGCRIGFLAFTDNEPLWAAGENHPGVLHIPVDVPDERTDQLLALVHEIQGQVDILIVSAHWGGNWGAQPPTTQVALAHRLVSAGADVVFGHSAHVTRGIEMFEGGLILYSAGDFIDDYAVDPIERNDRSWIFEISVRNQRIDKLDLHPTVIRDCQAQLAEGTEAFVMGAAMKELCAAFGTEVLASAGSDRLAIHVAGR